LIAKIAAELTSLSFDERMHKDILKQARGSLDEVKALKQRALRRIIQAKRRIVKQTKEKARRETKKMGLRPPIREAES
jgi:hypothetical protein